MRGYTTQETDCLRYAMQLPVLNAKLPPGIGLGGLLSAEVGSLSSWSNITIIPGQLYSGWLIVRLLTDFYNQFEHSDLYL